MTVNDRIKRVWENSQLTREKFGEKIGVKKSSISTIINGKSNPSDQTIRSICREFNVREEWLRTGEEPMEQQSGTVNIADLVARCGLDGEEKAVITQMLVKYFELQPETRWDIMRVFLNGLKNGTHAESYVQHSTQDNAINTVVAFLPVQLSAQPASAGTGVYLGPENFTTIYVQKNGLTERASFAVLVSGNSMEPRYRDGDILLVEGADDIEVGEIGIFTMDGDGYVKQRGENELISLNPSYPPIPMNESIWCNGRVIGTLPQEWIKQ